MASAQAIGGALSYNPFLSGDQNQKMFMLQRQLALAQALQNEGLTPIDTNNRQIGGVGYAISPFEGLNKLAAALTGTVGVNEAGKSYGDLYAPSPTTSGNQATPQMSGASTSGGSSGAYGLPSDIASLAAGAWTQNPGSVVDLVGKFRAPTEAQKNFGNNFDQWQKTQLYPGYAKTQEALATNFAGTQPYGTAPEGVGAAPAPVPQPTPPLQGVAPPPDAAQIFRQENGMQNPPIVDQRQGLGLPTGSNIPMGGQGVPPMSASALNAPQGSDTIPLPAPPMPVGNMPTAPMGSGTPSLNLSGLTNDQAAIVKEGKKKQAEAVGTATGEAIKGAATFDARYDYAKELIEGARTSAKNASYGFAPETLSVPFHNMKNDQTSVDNADFKNKMSQLLTQAIPAVVQASGGRIDIPLLNAIKEAEAADLSLSPLAKDKILDNLSLALDKQRETSHRQVSGLTGTPSLPPAIPTGAKQAPDGKYYLPDPNRPGKFLMVQ